MVRDTPRVTNASPPASRTTSTIPSTSACVASGAMTTTIGSSSLGAAAVAAAAVVPVRAGALLAKNPRPPPRGSLEAVSPARAARRAGWAGVAGGRVGGGRDLPPGQVVRADWPAQHYGRVPRFRPDTWTFTVMGATESGAEHRWDWAGITRLPRCAVTADLHCVTKGTIPGIPWEGIAAAEVLSAV